MVKLDEGPEIKERFSVQMRAMGGDSKQLGVNELG